MAKQNNLSNAHKGISWQGQSERKELAELRENERAIGLLLEYTKSIKVGGKEGEERELEWELE